MGMKRMYSREELKKIISELSGDLIEVKNIKQLSDEECNGLKVGDIVAKKTGEQYHCYIVTFKQDKGGLCLSYFDASCIETQSYDYTEGHWVYNSEDKTDFSNIGLPAVTAEDNEKVLEVIAGAWAKGRKKVSIIDAPTGSGNTINISDAISKAIMSGTFMNGLFGNTMIRNPISYPTSFFSGRDYSLICGSDNYGLFTFRNYFIDGAEGSRKIQLGESNKIIEINVLSGYLMKINGKTKPHIEVALTNLGTITSTETATGSGFYKNEIPYTDGIDVEDVVNVKMSNGAVYQAFNDTTNSKLVIYTGVDFASNNIEVSKCWKLAY